MKNPVLILGLFSALNASAALTPSGSYHSFLIETAGATPITVQLTVETNSCGVTGLSGEMRPVPASAGSGEQTIYMDYSAYSTYRACNPFVPPEKRLVKTAPLTIQPAQGVEQVKLIVPAGLRVEQLP